mmetsp:Transcript_86550/g.249918  ORF Transcript_86550/g.249918 Transcript_86550/m.249918 type:complete len:204 (+) Transcript_86550:565-1176(+)
MASSSSKSSLSSIVSQRIVLAILKSVKLSVILTLYPPSNTLHMALTFHLSSPCHRQLVPPSKNSSSTLTRPFKLQSISSAGSAKDICRLRSSTFNSNRPVKSYFVSPSRVKTPFAKLAETTFSSTTVPFAWNSPVKGFQLPVFSMLKSIETESSSVQSRTSVLVISITLGSSSSSTSIKAVVIMVNLSVSAVDHWLCTTPSVV